MKLNEFKKLEKDDAYYYAGVTIIHLLYVFTLRKPSVNFSWEKLHNPHLRVPPNDNFFRLENLRALIEHEWLTDFAGRVAKYKYSSSSSGWSAVELVIQNVGAISYENVKYFKPKSWAQWLMNEENNSREVHAVNFYEYLDYLSHTAFGKSKVFSSELKKAYQRFIILRCIQLFDNKQVWQMVKDIAKILLKDGTLFHTELNEIIARQKPETLSFLNDFASFHSSSVFDFGKTNEESVSNKEIEIDNDWTQ